MAPFATRRRSAFPRAPSFEMSRTGGYVWRTPWSPQKHGSENVSDIDEEYEITIRCNHGAKKPKVARAIGSTTGWIVQAVGHNPSIGISPRDPRNKAPRNQRGESTGSQMVYDAEVKRQMMNGERLSSAPKARTRHAIVCLGCDKRVVYRAERLNAALDRLRHAGTRTIQLGDLRLML